MRIFASDSMASMMDKMGMSDDAPIEHGMVSRAIENAQRRVEAQHFDSRKNLLEYDDVMNQQRKTIYEQKVLRPNPTPSGSCASTPSKIWYTT